MANPQANVNPFSAESAQRDGRLRQAQLKMFSMLKVIDALCLEHGLDYWLEGGTLLGAIRHQGFIPWDDDLDIAMPRASYETFLQIAPTKIPDNMWLQTAQSDPGYFNLSAPLKIRDRDSRFIEVHEQGNEPYQQGIFIDVFVYDVMPIGPAQRWYYKFFAKKLLRLMRHKYSDLAMGHHADFYQRLGHLIPGSFLKKQLDTLIAKANQLPSPYLGYGYDCVNSNLISKDELYPLQRGSFEGGEFNIPRRAEVILTQLYGDYLTLPPDDQRVMKHCRELIPSLSDKSAFEGVA